MDRLKALAIFKAVVDHGGFARAASAMDLSSSAVTRLVQELEQRLGVRLLQRTTRRVTLTPVGEAVFARATDLLASYDELEAFSSLSATEPHGLIRMAAPAAYGRAHLGQALAAFRCRWPRAAVDLRLRDTAHDGPADEADLVLCLGSDLRTSLIARQVARIEIGLYASARFLDLHGEPATPADLARCDGLVNRATRGAGWSLVHAGTGAREVVQPRAVMHSSHDEVLLEAAVHGAGIARLPAYLVDSAPAGSPLRRVLRDWQSDPVSVHLTYASRRNQPLAVRKLIEHLVDWFEADDPGAPHAPAAVPPPRRVAAAPLAA